MKRPVFTLLYHPFPLVHHDIVLADTKKLDSEVEQVVSAVTIKDARRNWTRK
jgi:hypothetical protein